MKQVQYKGCLLEGLAMPLRSGLWSPEGRVYRQQGASVQITPIYSRNGLTFSTANEAEDYALQLGKVSVDQIF